MCITLTSAPFICLYGPKVDDIDDLDDLPRWKLRVGVFGPFDRSTFEGPGDYCSSQECFCDCNRSTSTGYSAGHAHKKEGQVTKYPPRRDHTAVAVTITFLQPPSAADIFATKERMLQIFGGVDMLRLLFQKIDPGFGDED